MTSAIDGGTVVVTGASSGIGMEIARIVATRAKVLVLVARRVERLAKLKEELLGARRALQVEVIPCDLGNPDNIDDLVRQLRERNVDVDVLVNNAGVGMMGVFDRANPKKARQMIDLNVTSLSLLTLALLPKMVERGRGGILNISSGFGLSIMPSFALYIATKHFVTGFSEALIADLAGTGVVVTQVCPGPVETEFEQQVGNFTGTSPPKAVVITAEQCARAAIRGFDRGRAMVVPGFLMKIVLAFNGMSPRFMRRLFAILAGPAARRAELAAASRDGAIKDLPPGGPA